MDTVELEKYEDLLFLFILRTEERDAALARAEDAEKRVAQLEAQERWRPMGAEVPVYEVFQVMATAKISVTEDGSIVYKAPWEWDKGQFGGNMLCWWLKGNDWYWRPIPAKPEG